jgi:spore coat polysaccharide biosynthesis predicted glycosyltransferase SpsG/SAM-dependent methyltransferase
VTSLPKVLFCTAAGAEYGIGHLRRCLSLINAGQSYFESFLCILKGDKKCAEILQGYNVISRLEDAPSVELVFIDMRHTKRHEMRRLEKLAPVAAIDDAGAARDLAYVSIYSLPQLKTVCGNYTGPSYIVLDTKIKDLTSIPFDKKRGVTISFGGSDPENLTGYITRLLNDLEVYPTIVKGPLYCHDTSRLKGKIVEGGDDILDLINRSQMLITSFGITMYEAFYLGTPVILFNRTRYHYELGCKTGALNLGFKSLKAPEKLINELERIIREKSLLAESAEKNSSAVDGQGASRVAIIIRNALSAERKDCLFAHKRYKALRRSEDCTIMQCRRCSDLFLYELKKKGPVYDDPDYFLAEYKRKYGKSYINDRENIVKLGIGRINAIEDIKDDKGRLLDVGCALGFFLDLARSRGWGVEGIEISEYAARWAREHLALDVINADFLDAEIPPASFDVVCFFFTAEHFKNIEDVIEKVYVILKKGGLVCMALPNLSGVSFRLNRQLYLDQRPRDHYFDTNVRNIKKFLESYGFRRARVRITGIHSDRFFVGFCKRFFVRKITQDTGYRGVPQWVEKLYVSLAKRVSLGDTFEYYAVKE